MFKIVNKKEYEELIEELAVEKTKNKKIVTVLTTYEKDNKNLETILATYKRRISLLESDVITAGEKIRKLNGSTGGLIKENNKLKKENEELKSDRYLRRTLPEGKRPMIQKTKVTHAPNSKAQSYMRKESA